VLCDILPEFGYPQRKSCCSGTTYHIVWIETGLFGKHFQSAGQKSYPLCVYPKFTSKVLSVSLHDRFTLGAMATDKNCTLTRSKVVSRKVLNGLKRERYLWKALSKRQTVRIFLPLALRIALRKSRRKFLHIWSAITIKPSMLFRHLNWPIRCYS